MNCPNETAAPEQKNICKQYDIYNQENEAEENRKN